MPVLSVVVAAYNAVATIGDTLASLERQSAREFCEIIVVDSSEDGTGAFVKQHFPDVRLLEFPTRMFCGDARNEGIRAARGQIIVLTDADCSMGPTWLEDVLRSHEGAHPVVGGAIACGNPESYVGWGAYFTEFSAWQPSGRSRLVADMACANISYRRWIFDAYGKFIEGTYCSDTEFHWRLARGGIAIRFDPAIIVFHRNLQHLGRFLRHEFFHGMSFARMRCMARAISIRRRMGYFFLCPLIFLKLLLKNAGHGLFAGSYRASYLKALPVTVLGILSWTAGEATGYFRGPRPDACGYPQGAVPGVDLIP
ncbi:MAG: glycosyltransferase [Thermodesulfobacteriota bacterium]